MIKSTGKNTNKYKKRVDHEGPEEKSFIKNDEVRYIDTSEENKIYLNKIKISITETTERKTKYEIKKRVYTTYNIFEVVSLERLLKEKLDKIEKSLELKEKQVYKIVSIEKIKHIGYANQQE